MTVGSEGLNIALLQMCSGDDPAENRQVILSAMENAVDKGAYLLSTPEMSNILELKKSKILAKATREENDETLSAVCERAKDLGLWVHLGSLAIKVGKERIANRSFIVGPDGDIKARYDKIHMFDVALDNGETYTESRLYQAGAEAVVVPMNDFCLGLSICYDVRFPTLYRALAKAGANILMVPAAFTKQTGKAHWHSLLRARAIENGAFVVAAAQSGLHATGRETYGHSLVVDPWGKIIVDAGVTPGLYMASLDMGLVEKVRKSIPSLSHDRDFQPPDGR